MKMTMKQPEMDDTVETTRELVRTVTEADAVLDRPADELIIENLAHLLALARRSPEECEALLNEPQGRA